MSLTDTAMDRRDFLRRPFSAARRLAAPPARRLAFDQSKCWAIQGLDPGCDYCHRACPARGRAVTIQIGRGPEFDFSACDACGRCVHECPAQPAPLSIAEDTVPT